MHAPHSLTDLLQETKAHKLYKLQVGSVVKGFSHSNTRKTSKQMDPGPWMRVYNLSEKETTNRFPNIQDPSKCFGVRP